MAKSAGHMTFIFYDTETTGTQTAFDQILQFAAIRTDDELNELDRFDIRRHLYAVHADFSAQTGFLTVD